MASIPSPSHKRVKTPTVLQMEAVECGAASLAMILGYYGRIVPLEELRIECGVSRDGSKASNVVKAARQYGMEARGFKKDISELWDIEYPMVIFWNFNHFLVLEGRKGNKVYLNDPDSGPRTVTMEEFDQAFTGVVLTFKPGENFEQGGEKRKIIDSLKSRLKGCKTALTYVVLAGLFLVIPGLVIPTFSRVFVDNILVGGMDQWLPALLVAMLITAVMRGLLTWLQESYLLRLETRLAVTSSAKFFQHVFRLPVEFFSQRLPGELAGRVQLNDRVAFLLSGELATNFLSLIMVIFYLVLMFQYDVVLTLMGIGIAVLNLIGLKYISSTRTILNQRLQQETGKLLGVSMNGLQMIETLKASGAESDFFSQWAGHQSKVVNAQQDLAVRSQFLTIMPVFLGSMTTVAILGVGGIRVMDGHLSMGMLIAFQTLMASFMAPINDLINLGGRLQETHADLNKLDDVLKYNIDPRFEGEVRPAEEEDDDLLALADVGIIKVTGHVELQDVTFGYSRLEPALVEDFNLLLKPGARVALVGPSGSGKSTIAKVVSGLYRAWSGDILFDGESMEEIPRRCFTNSVAVVDQDIFLFAGTIRDNLTMWDHTIPERQLVQAAKDACIHEDIAARSGGYSSMVEEGGTNFSGGQRQRLEIARALVKNPTVLILDEATSALDPQTEKIVDDNLRRRGCTCIIVAHRLSTIRDADEIIVLKRGKVEQRGNHDALKDQEGLYSQLIKSH